MFGNVKGEECIFLWRFIGGVLATLLPALAYGCRVSACITGGMSMADAPHACVMATRVLCMHTGGSSFDCPTMLLVNILTWKSSCPVLQPVIWCAA